MEVVLDVDYLYLLLVDDVGQLWLLMHEVIHTESVLSDSGSLWSASRSLQKV